MPALPAFLMPRPAMPVDTETRAQFEALYAAAIGADGGRIDYRLEAPLWQFLCFLTDEKQILLHGSGKPDIARFEPRKAEDVAEFGDRRAVYAASDGIWPLYFAILDRDRHPMTLINSSIRIALDGGRHSAPYYFFSITAEALAQRPFRPGTIYLLPRAGFEPQPPLRYRDWDIHVQQWAGPAEVTPLARLSVSPKDFPFLGQLRGHDDESTFARARANPDGFPWVDEG